MATQLNTTNPTRPAVLVGGVPVCAALPRLTGLMFLECRHECGPSTTWPVVWRRIIRANEELQRTQATGAMH